METQLKKGILDILVLSTISKEDTYGYKIIQDILPIMELPESTLYTILKRLEEQLLVVTINKEIGGRVRKYYSITKSGKEKLLLMKGELSNLNQIIKFVLGEDNNE